jgi:hypothetical protein
MLLVKVGMEQHLPSREFLQVMQVVVAVEQMTPPEQP